MQQCSHDADESDDDRHQDVQSVAPCDEDYCHDDDGDDAHGDLCDYHSVCDEQIPFMMMFRVAGMIVRVRVMNMRIMMIFILMTMKMKIMMVIVVMMKHRILMVMVLMIQMMKAKR